MDDPKKPWKAVAATAVSFLCTFGAWWIADSDPFTSKEVVGGLIASATASGLTGGLTYAVRNPRNK